MAELQLTLDWLEIPQYFDRLVQAGFDSWETVLEITEEDLESLGFDLGHRRKLQREIANTRRLSQDPAFTTPLYDIPYERESSQSPSRSGSIKEDAQPDAPEKRAYRHRAKEDPNAPERPYSAYMLFTNHVREETKDQYLSFSDLSKRVGEMWRSLEPKEQDEWRQKAAPAWEKYRADLAKYQETGEHRQYKQYLTDFKAKRKAKKKASAQIKLPTGSAAGSTQQKTSPPSKASQFKRPGPPLSSSHPMAPPSSHRGEVKREDPQLLVSRVRKESYTLGPGVQSYRVAQACEPCRQRKTKCHGERPACKHCVEVNIECYYVDGKRDKDRRLIENLWRKVNAYEELLVRVVRQVDGADQAAIQQSLLLPPHLEDFNTSSSAGQHGDSISNASSDYGGGESTASGVGSMGSTGHANEEDFIRGQSEGTTKAFVGQASETRWMQRLERELANQPPSDTGHDPRRQVELPVSSRDKGPRSTFRSRGTTTDPNPYPEDMDTSVLGDILDPYDLPVRSIADRLIESFFRTVHPSFPLVDKPYFIAQYEQYLNTHDQANFHDRSFVATLQIVFAIAAVHAHLTGAEWAGHEKDHLLYFAKGRLLGVSTGILNDMAYLGQVLVFGLAAMYLTVTDQINRAWNTVGVAVRCAQSLGMHLISTTAALTNEKKSHRARAWCSIVTLERTLTVMTGRPSMVQNRDCSITVPPLMVKQGSSSGSGTIQQSSPPDHGGGAYGTPVSPPVQGPIDSRPSDPPRTPKAETYFYHFVELNSLAQQAVARLYCPDIRHMKWSDIQRRIEELDSELVRWNAALPALLKSDRPTQDSEVDSYRVGLAIHFYSTRTLINRPCLCRLDRRIHDQSQHSKSRNHAAAHRCVSSARAVLRLISERPHNAVLYQGTLWWMIFHHLKRAATVVLLELAFRAEHMPSEAGDILAEAKQAINWLHGIAGCDAAAHRSWVTLSRLLQKAAQKVGGDASEVVAAPSSQIGETRVMSDFVQQLPPVSSEQFDPHIWQSLDTYYTGHFLGDQEASGYDQYGFIQPGDAYTGAELTGGAQSMFSPMGGVLGHQDQQDDEQTMWPTGQEPPPGGWYGGM